MSQWLLFHKFSHRDQIGQWSKNNRLPTSVYNFDQMYQNKLNLSFTVVAKVVHTLILMPNLKFKSCMKSSVTVYWGCFIQKFILNHKKILTLTVFGAAIFCHCSWAKTITSISFFYYFKSSSRLGSTTTGFWTWGVAAPIGPFTIYWKYIISMQNW